MSLKSTSANPSEADKTREELVEDLERSRAEIARLKNIIAGQQKILNVRKASPAKRDELEACIECADTFREELLEKQRALGALNENREIHVEELNTRNEELLDAREALRKTEEEFRTIFERAGVAIFMADVGTGEIIECNAKAEELTGRPREETVGSHHTRLYPADMAAERRDAFARNAQKGLITNFETVVQHRDGRAIPVMINAARITVNGREVILGFFLDISERKRAEEALQLTQFALDNFLDSAIWVTKEGSITYVNRAACTTLGYSREELLSMHICDIDPNYTPEKFRELWPEKLQGRYTTFESKHVARDGRAFPVEITSCYTRYGDKELLITFDRDITERKQAEKALQRSERRLADIVNHLPDATFAVDREGRVIAWNYAIEEMTGVKAADMLGKGDYEYALPIYGTRQPILINLIFAPDEEIGRYINVKREGSAMTAEMRLSMPQGKDVALWVKATPFFDENGNSAGAIESIRDITEHKQIEEALRESEEKFRVLAETTKAGISLYRGDKSIYANPTLEKITGYTNAELLSANIWDLVHPDYRELVKKRAIDRQRGLSVPESYEFPVITKDGETRWVEVIAGLIMYQGELARMATYFDITERRRAEEKLKKSQYILAKSQEMAHVGNWAWNTLTGEIKGSDESYRIFGYAPGDARSTVDRLIAQVHPDDHAILEGLLKSALSEGKRSSVDYRVMRPDGSIRYVNALADKIVRDDDGKVRWVYGIMQDITERKQTEKALAEAKARAELYLDLMGHDINNMNQSAQGYLELAFQTLEMDGKIGADGRVLIEKPLQAVQSSSRLISNVRKLQRLADEGVKTRPVDLHDLFEELKSHDFHAGDKDATINVHEVPHCTVEGSDLLMDVFFNLISNAVKHSGPGKPVAIDVRVRVDRVNENGRIHCRCTVEDDGPGVPDDLKPRLFQRFQRGKTQARGKGLGLYLVRTLVEGYHGKVWVEDRVPGDHTKGARFVVMLPAIEK